MNHPQPSIRPGSLLRVRLTLFVTASRRLASSRFTLTVVDINSLVLTVLTFLSETPFRTRGHVPVTRAACEHQPIRTRFVCREY